MENVPKFERRRDGGTLTDSRQIADLCYRDETEGASDLGCSSTSSRRPPQFLRVQFRSVQLACFPNAVGEISGSDPPRARSYRLIGIFLPPPQLN